MISSSSRDRLAQQKFMPNNLPNNNKGTTGKQKGIV